MRFNREDVRISFRNPVFYVNEDKKTVVCTLKYVLKVPSTCFVPNGEALFGAPEIGIFCPIEGSVVAKSKCHADDVFDAKIGKDIAFARAENIAYTECYQLLDEYRGGLKALYDKISDFEIKYRNHNAHNSQYIKELGDNAEKKN